MRDPLCSNELLDPGMERMVGRISRGVYERVESIDAERDSSEGTVWRNPDRRMVNLPPVPISVRHILPRTRIEVKNRYRGFYVGEGVIIVEARLITSEDPNHLFERVWMACNPHRVRIEHEWNVSRIS